MKPFSIIIPFSGLDPSDLEKLSTGLRAWPGWDLPILIVTDRETPSHNLWTVRALRFDLGGWDFLDGPVGSAARRSLLVCRALSCFTDPLLIVEAGTIFEKDPRRSRLVDHENSFWGVPLAATGRKTISAPFAGVPRRDIGMMWFGGARRAGILTAYKTALEELRRTIRAGTCFEDEARVSELAWSLAAERLHADTLTRGDCGIAVPASPEPPPVVAAPPAPRDEPPREDLPAKPVRKKKTRRGRSTAKV